jgi:uncharacterized protein
MPEDIKVIDVMNYVFTPDVTDEYAAQPEVKEMAHRLGMEKFNPGIWRGYQPDEVVAMMDEAGYDKLFIATFKMWSYLNNRFVINTPPEKAYAITKKYPNRFVAMAGYNPFRITESLKEIEKAVKEYGFKGVYCHGLGFGVAANDRRMYPCYAKCQELGIVFSIQLGHSLELMPSDVGRPIYLDQVALDFLDLTIIGSHTGWPWVEEMIALASKYPNVYIDCSAHAPKYLDKSLLQFMNTRGRKKVLFGTNGNPLKEFKEQFLALGLREETNRAVLRENAIRIFKL